MLYSVGRLNWNSPTLEAALRSAGSIALGALLVSLLQTSPARPAAPENKAPEEGGPPPVSSPWQSWQFNGSLEKVRSELLALCREDGLAPDHEDPKSGSFRTGMVEFNDKKFGVDVSVPPPKASPKYPYFQLNDMTAGRYGLEARLSPGASGQTHLDLRALLEIQGMDQKIRAMRWIPRISNGEVERYYFTRLALRLLNPPADGASSQ
jgi:hypothetical protein